MSKLHLGYVQGTHGLRGDLKIKNLFKNPEKVYIVGKKIYLNEELHEITYVKYYKNSYLVEIDNLRNINLVEQYKGYDLYIDRDEISLSDGEFLYCDLIGMKIVSNGKIYGTVDDILSNGIYEILKVKYNKDYMIPVISQYLEKVDTNKKEIYIKNVEGLII